MTTATAATWPTTAELDRVEKLLADAGNALDELHLTAYRFSRDVDKLAAGGRLPTLEEIGRLSHFIAGAELEIEFLGTHLREIRSARDVAALSVQQPGADHAS
jgi:hypothetical protein